VEIAAANWPEVFLSRTSKVEEKLDDIENKFPCIIDFYCIMPDHIHMIIGLHQRTKMPDETGKCLDRIAPKRVKIGTVVSAFKSWTTRGLGFSVFQPKYYEHIVREDKALARIRDYILRNPYALNLCWKELEKC
jgi:putative transposase